MLCDFEKYSGSVALLERPEKVYFFSEREKWYFLKREKCKDKDLISHMVGEIVKR